MHWVFLCQKEYKGGDELCTFKHISILLSYKYHNLAEHTNFWNISHYSFHIIYLGDVYCFSFSAYFHSSSAVSPPVSVSKHSLLILTLGAMDELVPPSDSRKKSLSQASPARSVPSNQVCLVHGFKNDPIHIHQSSEK